MYKNYDNDIVFVALLKYVSDLNLFIYKRNIRNK